MAANSKQSSNNHSIQQNLGTALHDVILNAPALPGCYIIKDAEGTILYVGKAKNLKTRLRNYINQTDGRYSVTFLMRRAAHVEYLTVATEKEALLLENNLIKTYKPRYNVRLRDDKTFISIRLDPNEPFPRLTVVRRRKNDGAKYYGPYHDAKAARKTIRQLQRYVPMRLCSDHEFRNRVRPCLYYQMKQCHAPCVGYISAEAYQSLVHQAMLFLEGRNNDLTEMLTKQMQTLAKELRFEEAAMLRDRLIDLKTTLEPQRAVIQGSFIHRDVFGYHAENHFLIIQVLYYRNGVMVGGKSFSYEQNQAPLPEVFTSFLLQFYDQASTVPSEILLPVHLEDKEALEEILTEKLGLPISIRVPLRGTLAGLVALAKANAQTVLQTRRQKEKSCQETLEKIRMLLRLQALPHRIECFDISTIQGDCTVGAMAVFEEGNPAKDRYRRYQITHTSNQDDFAAMREVLERRYKRGKQEHDLPDLIVIDGGKGHLQAALSVLAELELHHIPCVSIAKARNRKNRADVERFFIPGRANPIVPKQNNPAILLLARIRNEAHRFAVTYHRKKRAMARLKNPLLNIPGIGPAKAQQLLSKFGSLDRIKAATREELVSIPSISVTLAEKIVASLQQEAVD